MRWLAYFVTFNLGLFAVIMLMLWAITDLFSGSDTLSIHGWIAMILGIVLTSALGVLLMSLAFYSHRSQRDDDVHRANHYR